MPLGVESRDFSQVEKERTACKAGQIHKMTATITQSDNFLFENYCNFVNLLSFASSSFFSALEKSLDSTPNSQKLEVAPKYMLLNAYMQ